MNFRNKSIEELKPYVGSLIKKRSGKPFKSKQKEDKVLEVVTHNITQRPAFVMLSDNSEVEAGQCALVER